MEKFYPVILDLRDKKCVVVGGGPVAARKAETLLNCGARVTVISPEPAPVRGEIEHIRGDYEARYLENAFIVIGATADEAVNRRVAADCAARGIPVNIADDPELCSFYVPALVSRGPLSIAVSTAGRSPAFAQLLQEELERRYGEVCGDFVTFLGELRPRIRAAVPDPARRQALYRELAGPDFFHLFKSLPSDDLALEVDAKIKELGE